ncbi:hypothetical protein J6S46_03080, partial [Candidatus Saccharibacteria bacterium]|nr:hypothetical protein [Candidatus Saccharibacteria bacterium]
GKKISKSLGNVYSLADLTERGFSALDYKMWVLSGHYQGERNFTFESLEGARARRLNWRNRIAECYQREISGAEEAINKVLEALNNNLNSPEAFALIDGAELSLNDWKKVDELFGLRLIDGAPEVSEEVLGLITEREKARETKDFVRADEIRDKLAEQGITVKDTPNGPIWQYI